MTQILLKEFEQAIELDKSINIIRIENIKLYRNLLYDLDNYLVLSKDNEKCKINKDYYPVYNVQSLDYNEPKFIKVLYKKLENEVDTNITMKIDNIEKNIIELIDDLSFKSNIDLEYDELVLSKLFSSINLKFTGENKDNFLNFLLRYIQTIIEMYNIKIFVSFGLSILLSNEEIIILEKELVLLEVKIIDFYYHPEEIKNDIIIDKDFCII